MKKLCIVFVMGFLYVHNNFSMGKKNSPNLHKIKKIFNKKTTGLLKDLLSDNEKSQFERLPIEKKLAYIRNGLQIQAFDVADAIGYTVDKVREVISLGIDEMPYDIKDYVDYIQREYIPRVIGNIKDIPLYTKLKKLPDDAKAKVVEKWIEKNQDLFSVLLPKSKDRDHKNLFDIVLLMDNYKSICTFLFSDIDSNNIDDIQKELSNVKKKIKLSRESRNRLILLTNMVDNRENGIPASLKNRMHEFVQQVKEKSNFQESFLQKCKQIRDRFCFNFFVPTFNKYCDRWCEIVPYN